jgi:thioredoxin reductase (NADPH)
MFYKGKTIAVLCGAKRYEHEVKYLAEIAEKVVLFAAYPGCEVKAENVERLSGAIREVKGEKRVSSVVLKDGTEISVDGLFCLRSAISPTALLPGLKLEGPHISVDRQMRTNIPGCFAAGDCVGAPYQIAKAVGDGNVAAHAALDYLAETEESK